MIVRSSLEGYNKITIEGRTVFWPPQADLDRVIDMYFEVFKPNSHQFDSHDTELHSGDVVIDIGGCEGYFSLKALEKGADTVFCFEPGRLAVKCLESTFAEEIKAGKVEVMNQILGAASGEIVFGDNPFDPTLGRVSGPKTSADMTYYRLPVTTIDKFCVEKQLRRLDFVKIDVEGSEMEVLQGATSSIVRFSPAIAIAAYHKPSHAKELQALIKSLDRDYTVKIHGLVDLGGIVRPVMLHCFKKARKRS